MLLVMIMIAVPSVMLSVSDDVHAEVYLEATSGSGTIDDPYNGYLDIDMEDWTYPMFIEVGTTMNVYGGNYNDDKAWTIQNGEDYGLSMNKNGEYYITGTVDRIGMELVTGGYYSTQGTIFGLVFFVPEGFDPVGTDYLYSYYDYNDRLTNQDELDGTEILSMAYVFSTYSSDEVGEYTLYQGSPIYIDGLSLESKGDNSITVNDDGSIVGVLDGTEPLVLEIADGSIVSPRFLTLTPYLPYPELDFTSDPVSDGIIIPPGHHLVTVVSSESGQIENRFVVEHGHILDEVDLPLPTQAPGYYLIYDSSADEYVDGRGYAVTENVTVLHYPHGDPGPGAGGEIVDPEL